MRWIISTSLVAVSIFTIIVVFVSRNDSDVATEPTSIERQRTMSNVKIVGAASESGVNYTIEAEALRQFPDQGISELERPRIYQHYPDGTYRQTRASSGVYHESTNIVVLKGDVVVALTKNDQSGSVVSHMDTLTIELNHALE